MRGLALNRTLVDADNSSEPGWYDTGHQVDGVKVSSVKLEWRVRIIWCRGYIKKDTHWTDQSHLCFTQLICILRASGILNLWWLTKEMHWECAEMMCKKHLVPPWTLAKEMHWECAEMMCKKHLVPPWTLKKREINKSQNKQVITELPRSFSG